MSGIFTAQHVFSVIFILLSWYQFRNARNYKKTIMKRGTGQPVSFGAMMIWYNYVTAGGLLCLAIMLLVGPLSQ